MSQKASLQNTTEEDEDKYYPWESLPKDIHERCCNIYKDTKIMEELILDNIDLNLIPPVLPVYLKYLDQLFDLSVEGCNLVMLPLTSHPNLVRYHLSDNLLSEKSFQNFDFPSLGLLDLKNNNLTDPDFLTNILQDFSEFKELTIEGNKLNFNQKKYQNNQQAFFFNRLEVLEILDTQSFKSYYLEKSCQTSYDNSLMQCSSENDQVKNNQQSINSNSEKNSDNLIKKVKF